MITVGFTNSTIEGIQSFEKYKFPEAYALTHALNVQPKNEGKTVEFVLLQEEETVYRGTFECGREEVENIYQHVTTHLRELEVKGNDRETRDRLLATLYQSLHEEAKTYENRREEQRAAAQKAMEEVQGEKTDTPPWFKNIKVMYPAFGGVIMALIGVILITGNQPHPQALANQIEEEESQLINEAAYKDILLNQGTGTIAALEEASEDELQELTEEEREIIASLYVDYAEYEKATNYLHVEQVAELVRAKGIDTLKAFHESHPTSTGHVTLAKHYLSQGEIDAAKAEAEGVDNDTLNADLSNYETLQSDIAGLRKAIEEERDQDEDDQDDGKIKGWEEEITAKEQELTDIREKQ